MRLLAEAWIATYSRQAWPLIDTKQRPNSSGERARPMTARMRRKPKLSTEAICRDFATPHQSVRRDHREIALRAGFDSRLRELLY